MSSTRPVIVPAVIPRSAAHIHETCAQLQFATEYHLDIVDGDFVPTVSWPISPKGYPDEVAVATDQYTLEVDLMVREPIAQAIAWEKARADMVVFHIETISATELQSFATQSRMSIGVSLHGDTPLTALHEYLPNADYVQLMGIRTIGAQGLPFDERVLEQIAWVRTEYPQYMISVDGSMNQTTISRVVAAGANRIICGSAIIGQPDPAAAYQMLVGSVDGQL